MLEWWYVSFADETSHGVVVIPASGFMDAIERCRALDIEPKGKVLGAPMPEEILAMVPQADRERLLSNEDCVRLWPLKMTPP